MAGKQFFITRKAKSIRNIVNLLYFSTKHAHNGHSYKNASDWWFGLITSWKISFFLLLFFSYFPRRRTKIVKAPLFSDGKGKFSFILFFCTDAREIRFIKISPSAINKARKMKIKKIDTWFFPHLFAVGLEKLKKLSEKVSEQYLISLCNIWPLYFENTMAELCFFYVRFFLGIEPMKKN